MHANDIVFTAKVAPSMVSLEGEESRRLSPERLPAALGGNLAARGGGGVATLLRHEGEVVDGRAAAAAGGAGPVKTGG